MGASSAGFESEGRVGLGAQALSSSGRARKLSARRWFLQRPRCLPAGGLTCTHLPRRVQHCRLSAIALVVPVALHLLRRLQHRRRRRWVGCGRRLCRLPRAALLLLLAPLVRLLLGEKLRRQAGEVSQVVEVQSRGAPKRQRPAAPHLTELGKGVVLLLLQALELLLERHLLALRLGEFLRNGMVATGRRVSVGEGEHHTARPRHGARAGQGWG